MPCHFGSRSEAATAFSVLPDFGEVQPVPPNIMADRKRRDRQHSMPGRPRTEPSRHQPLTTSPIVQKRRQWQRSPYAQPCAGLPPTILGLETSLQSSRQATQTGSNACHAPTGTRYEQFSPSTPISPWWGGPLTPALGWLHLQVTKTASPGPPEGSSQKRIIDVKRECNQWADDLTHPDYHGFDVSKPLDVSTLYSKLRLVPYPTDRTFDFTHAFRGAAGEASPTWSAPT